MLKSLIAVTRIVGTVGICFVAFETKDSFASGFIAGMAGVMLNAFLSVAEKDLC